MSLCMTLCNGMKVPMLGLGTWKAPKHKVTHAVKCAISLGYRHIDTAYIYGNEREVGCAITAKIYEGTVTREELFVTNKLWNSFHRPDCVVKAIQRSLTAMRLDYFDSYLIHWPMAFKEGCEPTPLDKKGRILFSNVDYVDTYMEMERLIHFGLAKSIGLCNFNEAQILRILERATVVPVINQIESHPYLNQDDLKNFCDSVGIAVTAYCPLGAPNRPNKKKCDPNVMDDSIVKMLACQYKATPAQILLRYQIDRGNLVIPTSVKQEHMEENLGVKCLKLSNDDIDEIHHLEMCMRYISAQRSKNHKYYPFVM